jgi:hypothetical protein
MSNSVPLRLSLLCDRCVLCALRVNSVLSSFRVKLNGPA